MELQKQMLSLYEKQWVYYVVGDYICNIDSLRLDKAAKILGMVPLTESPLFPNSFNFYVFDVDLEKHGLWSEISVPGTGINIRNKIDASIVLGKYLNWSSRKILRVSDSEWEDRGKSGIFYYKNLLDHIKRVLLDSGYVRWMGIPGTVADQANYVCYALPFVDLNRWMGFKYEKEFQIA